ncbi:hypothetical protein B9479_008190 [Cryptococcus floricola]|uniref:Chromo domain-containing protein n=1 Tax=Cryptococcus floricola TaxID=2591691 RepID=A0A5D3AKC0_9TREE|nr:hypothetical protein B9479_008190 [Cryptococcus floricola]
MPWRHLSMDFIEPLPPSNSYNSILVIFVSKFWRHLTTQLGIKLNLSTAYHPQTDGQTERVNQTVEQYLRVFTSYNQDDWDTLLPQASFHYNNSLHSTIRFTPFFANFGYHPRWADELRNADVTVPDAVRVASSLLEIHSQCSANIALANKRYAAAYNKKHSAGPVLEVGDLVLLSMENMKTMRPSNKLDYRNAGPFKVLTKTSSHAYQLDIPPDWHRFDIFPVSLLRPYHPPLFPNQPNHPSPPPPLDNDDTVPVYRINYFLASRNNSETGRLEYLVQWQGLEGTAEQCSWQSPQDLTDDPLFSQAVDQFHRSRPNQPSSDIPPPRPRFHKAKPKPTPTPTSTADFSPANLSTPPTSSSSPPNPIATPNPTTSTPTTNPKLPFRPKQPSNWKGWKLELDAPKENLPTPHDGPTSRSGRPLHRKVPRD